MGGAGGSPPLDGGGGGGPPRAGGGGGGALRKRGGGGSGSRKRPLDWAGGAEKNKKMLCSLNLMFVMVTSLSITAQEYNIENHFIDFSTVTKTYFACYFHTFSCLALPPK